MCWYYEMLSIATILSVPYNCGILDFCCWFVSGKPAWSPQLKETLIKALLFKTYQGFSGAVLPV